MDDQSNDQKGGGEGSKEFISGGGKDKITKKTDKVNGHRDVKKGLT
jgi:hypothetical protein